MGLAALAGIVLSVFPPAPFAAASTQAGSVNGVAFTMAAGVARETPRALVARLVQRYGRKRAVWFVDHERGLFWQWLGPVRAEPADVREAVRSAKSLAKRTAERNMPGWGWLVYVFDMACAAGRAAQERCELLSIRELASILEALASVGAWQTVELHAGPDGSTAWTWVAYDGGRLSRLLPADDPVVLEDNCRFAPYPLPRGARCQLVASFAGAQLNGRFVSFATDGAAAPARESLERDLVASGWVADGDRFVGPTGSSLRVRSHDDRSGARVLMMETP